MPTIEPVSHAAASAATRTVYDDIMRTYGLPEPRSIYRLMGHTPAHLAASWPRSRYLYGRDSAFSIKEKHLLTLAISAINGCEYCCRSHTVRLKQLGTTHAEILETLAITAGETAETALSVLSSAMPEANAPSASDGGAKSFEGRSAASSHWPHVLAFAVAAVIGSDKRVRLHQDHLKRLGVSEDALLELLFLVDVVCGYNRYVQGLQVDPYEGVATPWGKEAEANQAPTFRAVSRSA